MEESGSGQRPVVVKALNINCYLFILHKISLTLKLTPLFRWKNDLNCLLHLPILLVFFFSFLDWMWDLLWTWWSVGLGTIKVLRNTRLTTCPVDHSWGCVWPEAIRNSPIPKLPVLWLICIKLVDTPLLCDVALLVPGNLHLVLWWAAVMCVCRSAAWCWWTQWPGQCETWPPCSRLSQGHQNTCLLPRLRGAGNIKRYEFLPEICLQGP